MYISKLLVFSLYHFWNKVWNKLWPVAELPDSVYMLPMYRPTGARVALLAG